MYLIHGNHSAAFYNPGSRFWELMIGGLLAYLKLHRPHFTNKWINIQSICGFVLIGLALVVNRNTSLYPGWWALLPTIGAYLVISAGLNAWLNQKILANKVLVGIGLISYPIYLWHWPILSFTWLIIGEATTSLKIALIILSLVLAWLTYKFIEKPIRFGSKKNYFVLALLASMCGIFLLGFFISINLITISPLQEKTKNEYLSYFENAPDKWNYFNKIHLPERYRYDCDFYNMQKFRSGHATNKPLVAINPACYTRNTKYTHSVFIWGDSHAQFLYYGLSRTLPKNWQILQVASSGCIPSINKLASSTSDYCEQSNWFAVKNIKSARPDVVVVGQQDWHDIDKMLAISKTLKNLGVNKIIFTGPTPHWNRELPKIIARSLWSYTPTRTFLEINKSFLTIDELLKKQAKKSNINYVSIIDVMCNQNGCLTYLGNDKKTGITTWDTNHLSPIASEYLAIHSLAPAITL